MQLMQMYEMQEILQDCGAFIYMNDDADLNVTKSIITGSKIYETRPRDVFSSITANGKNQFRQRVGLTVRHGGRRFFFGDCVLVKVKEYHSGDEFAQDFEFHRINRVSRWFKTKGVAYLIADPRFCPMTPLDIPEKCRIGNRSYFRLRKED